MAISEEALRITKHIYKVFGTDSGYLLGIEPDKRHSVEAIVQCTLDYKEIEKLANEEG